MNKTKVRTTNKWDNLTSLQETVVKVIKVTGIIVFSVVWLYTFIIVYGQILTYFA
jgi:hypothetical protein